jgi:hypothetical protein
LQNLNPDAAQRKKVGVLFGHLQGLIHLPQDAHAAAPYMHANPAALLAGLSSTEKRMHGATAHQHAPLYGQKMPRSGRATGHKSEPVVQRPGQEEHHNLQLFSLNIRRPRSTRRTVSISVISIPGHQNISAGAQWA